MDESDSFVFRLPSFVQFPMSRILVVDDDKKIVRLVQSYLEKGGYQVLTAYDGETALHTIRRERPDLVVLDLMLPDRDGWEITRIIRADESLAGLPIVMLTARVEDTDKLVGFDLGADDYIVKPVKFIDFVQKVGQLDNYWAFVSDSNPGNSINLENGK